VVGLDPLQVTRHSIQGLVADQAAATQSIPIITVEHAAAPAQDHGPRDRPLGHGQQEQQQQQLGQLSSGGAAYRNLVDVAVGFDTPPAAATQPAGGG
jgi:hypothetical protein